MDGRDDLSQSLHLLDDFLQPLNMLAPRGPLRAMRELVRGMVFTCSVQLSNAARWEAQRPRPLRRIVERLSGHLADVHWDHREWAAAVLEYLCQPLEEDDLIPIDATELAKPYARHMQYLCTVKDASRVGDPLVNGYWCLGCHHWRPEDSTLTPLMLRPYSPAQPGYLSENDLFQRWLWSLRQATGGRGIWLIDRGGDRPELFSILLRIQKRWIVRLRQDRALVGPDGSVQPAGFWAQWALQHRNERGRAVTLAVTLPPADLPQYVPPQRLFLVVPTYTFIRNGKPERWLLLTCGLIGHQTGPRQVRHEYALRWRAEDAKRFLGQIWHAERFLTRSWLALERMLTCLCLAGGFLGMLQRERPKLSGRLQEKVLYHEKSAIVPAYRLARGLHAAAMQAGRMTMINNA